MSQPKPNAYLKVYIELFHIFRFMQTGRHHDVESEGSEESDDERDKIYLELISDMARSPFSAFDDSLKDLGLHVTLVSPPRDLRARLETVALLLHSDYQALSLYPPQLSSDRAAALREQWTAHLRNLRQLVPVLLDSYARIGQEPPTTLSESVPASDDRPESPASPEPPAASPGPPAASPGAPAASPEPSAESPAAVTQSTSVVFDPVLHMDPADLFTSAVACDLCASSGKTCVWGKPGTRCDACIHAKKTCMLLINGKSENINDFGQAQAKAFPKWKAARQQKPKRRLNRNEVLTTVTVDSQTEKLAAELAVWLEKTRLATEEVHEAHKLNKEIGSQLEAAVRTMSALSGWVAVEDPVPQYILDLLREAGKSALDEDQMDVC